MSKLFKSKLAFGLVVAFALVVATTASAYTFTRTIRQGSTGPDVMAFQQALNGSGHIVSSTGAGSPGYESSFFGSKTSAAAKLWQSANGLVADGIIGAKSRAVLNAGGTTTSSVPGCMPGALFSSTTGASCTGGTTTTLPAGCTSTSGYSSTTGVMCNGTTGTVTSGAAMLALSMDTPASSTVPDAANANFTKFTLSSGSTPTTITSLYVTRYGLSINSDVENIKILDENMVQVSSSGSLNSNNKAQISFSPALTIPANTVKTFYIRAGIVDGTTGGKTVAFGIDAATDVVANVTVGGSFPVKGNYMSTVLLTIGTLTADEDGTVTDSQPDGGDLDVVVNKFKLTAGSTEAVTVKQIAVERQGTAAATDIANIELYDVTKAQSVGTVAAWDANGKATFNNLNIVLDKGETRRFEVRVDIVGGASLTVNADLTDGSDVLVQAMGNTYGFYISVTNSMTNGQGASNQTIQTGSLTVTKSSQTPATGNIAAGSDIHLATFDFQVQGEPVKITSINLDSTLGTMVYTEVTNVKLTDATTGALLAGPKDLVVTTEDATFTDVLILPVGTTKVKVTANIATSVSASDTVKIDLDDPSTGIVVKGMTSNDSITPTPAPAVSGNTMTVQAASLTATTLTTPAARSIVKGQQDFIFATLSLSAANSGEDVNVTSIVVENSVTNADADAADLDNVELWADLTAASSTRGDVYETKISDTKQFGSASSGDAVLTFSLNPIVTVPKNGTVNVAVFADLSADADTSDTHTVSFDTDSGDVTANGKDTGSSITLTPSGAGQAMTVSAGGTLTLTVDSSSPVASLLLDSSAEQTAAVFRLAANNTENLNVDSFKITDDGSNGNDVVAAYKFYSNNALLGSVTPDGSGNAELFLTSGQLVVPANDYKLVTVKAVLNNIDGSGFVNGDTIIVTVNAAGDVDTTGVASGSAVDSTDTSVDATTHTAYEAYPVVSFAADASIGSVITLASNQLVAKIAVTNPGDKDVTFQSGDTNIFSIQVVVTGTDTDTANETVTLKDQDGTILDTGTISSATGTTQIDFDMSSVGATVGTTFPAGQTKYLYVYADTSDMETAGNIIQITLDDTAADATFGINGSGAYAAGDIVFRNDPAGPVLSKE